VSNGGSTYAPSKLRRVASPVHNPNNPWAGGKLLIAPHYRSNSTILGVIAQWTLPDTHLVRLRTKPSTSRTVYTLSTWIGLGNDDVWISTGFDSGGFVSGGQTPTRWVELGSRDGQLFAEHIWGSADTTHWHYGDTVHMSLWWKPDKSVYLASMINQTTNVTFANVALDRLDGARGTTNGRINATEARFAVEIIVDNGSSGDVISWGKVIFDKCGCVITNPLPGRPGAPSREYPLSPLPGFFSMTPVNLHSTFAPINASVRDDTVTCDATYQHVSASDFTSSGVPNPGKGPWPAQGGGRSKYRAGGWSD
jgi:hypothetical protein